MIRVLDGLYLGNRHAAENHRVLREAGVTHVVNCAGEVPNYHVNDFVYLPLTLQDPDPAFHRQVGRFCTFIDRALDARGQVLVHCYAAISRSPSVVLAYLCHLGWSLDKAATHLGALVWTDPDLVMLEQIARRFDFAWNEQAAQRLYDLLHGRADVGGP